MKFLPPLLVTSFLLIASAVGVEATQSNVYIAVRTDGQAGSGTQADPYDGSTEAKFDARMKSFGTNVDIHLLAGTFLTYGDDAYWIKGGWTIEGAGEGATIIKLVGHTSSESKHFNLLGYASNVVIKELTCDGNAQNTNWPAAHDAVGSVTVFGSNVLIDHVEVINCYGDTVDGEEQFSILTGGPNSQSIATGCVIQNCLTHDYAPGSTYTNGPNMTCTTDAQVLNCVDDGSNHAFTFSTTVGGVIRGCTTSAKSALSFYTDTGAVSGLTIEGNNFASSLYPIQFNCHSAMAENITISNNALQSSNSTHYGSAAILLSGSGGSNFEITGNVFTFAGTGISGFILNNSENFTDLLIENNSSNVGLDGAGGAPETITSTTTLANNHFNEPIADLTTPDSVPDSSASSSMADDSSSNDSTPDDAPLTNSAPSTPTSPSSDSSSDTASTPTDDPMPATPAAPSVPAAPPADSAQQLASVVQNDANAVTQQDLSTVAPAASPAVVNQVVATVSSPAAGSSVATRMLQQRFSQPGSHAASSDVVAKAEGFSEPQAVASFVQHWATSQPSATAAWIARLPQGPVRDAAIQSFSNQLAQTSPTQSADVAALLQNWMESHSVADAQALENSSLPEVVKDSLLSSPE